MTDHTRAAPGFEKHADHKIVLTPLTGDCRAVRAGQTLAQSSNVLVMQEASYDPVWYFPPGAVVAGGLTRTDHTSYCPFKGQASYWSVASVASGASEASEAGNGGENVAWAYEDPYDEMARIKGYVAFYGDRVDLIQS